MKTDESEFKKKTYGWAIYGNKGQFQSNNCDMVFNGEAKKCSNTKKQRNLRNFLNKDWCVGVGMKYFLNSFFDIMKYVIIMVFI